MTFADGVGKNMFVVCSPSASGFLKFCLWNWEMICDSIHINIWMVIQIAYASVIPVYILNFQKLPRIEKQDFFNI